MSREMPSDAEGEEDFAWQDSAALLRPRIFEGKWYETIPDGFDAVVIELDARLESDLDWKKARGQALEASQKGYFILWNMEMGLFGALAKPLSCESQFLSLTLALEHFRDTLWKEFRQKTIGLSLFRGPADFTQGFKWDEPQEANLKNWLESRGFAQIAVFDFPHLIQEPQGKELATLFCRDVAIEYISLLSSRLPDPLPVYLYLDARMLPEGKGRILSELQMLNPERFDRLRLALKGNFLPFEALGWEHPTPWGYCGLLPFELPKIENARIGVCIPPMQSVHSDYDESLSFALAILKERSIPFRLIAERELASSWEGLDYLLYDPAGLSHQGKRMLQGFCAAGGCVISSANPMGLEEVVANNFS